MKDTLCQMTTLKQFSNELDILDSRKTTRGGERRASSQAGEPSPAGGGQARVL